ncbi:MAG: gliding motility-associated ABC transporter ATP-binding subunit GldA [Chlorobi bacterium]|nr:gliding motility-associated ABC transporter ATP-binding subunit GldA [Chlorobiota bacterium]
MSIEVRNVTKYYGEQKALDNISFSVPAGQVTGFLGPNGAGKSTMMKIITGSLPPSSGEALVRGIDIRSAPVEVKRHIGYLSEHNPLYPEMFVREYLMYVAGIYHLGRKRTERVAEIISITGLEREKQKKIGSLSKGYRQRVGLAQALIHDPEVLILDEPTSGLDPNQIIEIRELIKNLGEEKTVLLSTHIMQEVEAICDRVIIIHHGKIVADEPEKNITRLKSGTNLVILTEFNNPPEMIALQKIRGVTRVTASGNKENNHTFRIECTEDIREAIFRFAVENNLSVLSLQALEQSLEDVFRELTR